MPNSMNINPPTPSVTPGPQWAQEINDILTNIIAEHNHQPAQDGGVQLTQDALTINDELSLNGNQLINVNAVGLETLNAPASGSNRLYNDTGDLYYKDGNGTSVRITENGGLAAASFGGISGLSGTNGSATFAGLSTFVWKKDAGEYASMENADVLIYNGSETNPLGGVKLQTPTGLSSNKTVTLPSVNLTLPTSLPNAAPTTANGVITTPAAATSSLFIDPSGVVTWDYVPPLNFVSSSAILTGSYNGSATTITNSSLAFTSSGRPLYVEVLGGGALTGFWSADTTSSPMWFTLTTRVVHQNGTTYNQQVKTYRVVDENTLLGSFYPYSGIVVVPSGTMTVSLRVSTAGGGSPSSLNIGESGYETYFSVREL